MAEHYVLDLADDVYPEAAEILLVSDNLNTLTAACFYEAFPPDQAHRLASKLEQSFGVSAPPLQMKRGTGVTLQVARARRDRVRVTSHGRVVVSPPMGSSASRWMGEVAFMDPLGIVHDSTLIARE